MGSALAAVPILLLLLSWLLLRTINPEAERFDVALVVLDRLSVEESALHRVVLSQRAGILRNYDPLVREMNEINASLVRLREVSGADEEETSAIDHLASSVVEQDALVEQFKTDNALLQNSLAYVAMFSTRLGASGRTGPAIAAASALAAAMLHLTLNTSPTSVREVTDRLDDLTKQTPSAEDAEFVRALLAHGRLLHDLLPATDRILKTLFALPWKQDQEMVRKTVLAHQSESRASARQFQTLLFAASMFLLVLLAHVGLRLRALLLARRRRAAFEHVIAGISMRFISVQPEDIDANINRALTEMAECIGADRAYFLLSGPTERRNTWCRPGMSFTPGWPEQARALADRFKPAMAGIVHVPNVKRLSSGADKDACIAHGLQSWACASSTDVDGVNVVLGFDGLLGRSPTRGIDDLGLLRMARDTIVNAVERGIIEQERSRLEARFQHARRMETVGALASGIAHNFNNIIGAILGHAEMAQARVTIDEHAGHNLDEIHRAGERARDLVDQILAFGRHRNERRKPVSVRALITEAAALLRASLPATIDLVVHEAQASAIIPGDPVQLQQVLLNLCTNAAQAMDGTGRIEVETHVDEIPRARALSHGELAPGRHVCIAVSDAGCGIDEASLDRIFEPFFTMRPSGNGLGLATVREIVHEHGGAIDVESRIGQGSRFKVWLPRLGSAETSAGPDSLTLPLGRGETVLVVDADREQLLRHEELLAALGYEPVGLSRADDALAACRTEPDRFDAVIVHLVPKSAALGLASVLRRLAPRLPILLAMASVDEIDSRALMAAGITEITRRPLVSAEVATALVRCFAGAQHRPLFSGDALGSVR